jgi:type I restriction enzyme S subunit
MSGNGAWLDHLPTNWRTLRLKHAAPLRREHIDTVDSHDYVGLENVEPWTGQLIPSEVALAGSEDESKTVGRGYFEPGDVLFGKLRPYLAKAFYARHSGQCSTEFMVLKPGPDLDGRYLLHVVLSEPFVRLVDSTTFGAKMPRANWDAIGSLSVPIPPLTEQQRIAAWLNAETSHLDALVAEKERMLVLLAERRAARVSQAVTRGLDPTIPLRPSGLEWLGDIPAHWKVRRVKHFATVTNGSTPSRENPRFWAGGDFPWLNSSVVNSRHVRTPSRYVTVDALKECHLPVLAPPAVLMAITGQGKTRGTSAVLEINATINQHVAAIIPAHDSVDPLYLSYQFDTAYTFVRSESEGVGSTRGAITTEYLANFQMALPPRDEQLEILRWIESAESIDVEIEIALRASLSLLIEQRRALVSAAVTGRVAPPPSK